MPPNFRCIIFLRLVDLNMSEFNSASTHYDRSRTSIGPEWRCSKDRNHMEPHFLPVIYFPLSILQHPFMWFNVYICVLSIEWIQWSIPGKATGWPSVFCRTDMFQGWDDDERIVESSWGDHRRANLWRSPGILRSWTQKKGRENHRNITKASFLFYLSCAQLILVDYVDWGLYSYGLPPGFIETRLCSGFLACRESCQITSRTTPRHSSVLKTVESRPFIGSREWFTFYL
jgi:hypothetical protein